MLGNLEVLSGLMPLVETSLSVSDILSLADILRDGFSIETLVIPGNVIEAETGIYENGAWMWTYDSEQAANVIHEFIYEAETEPQARTVAEPVSADDESAEPLS